MVSQPTSPRSRRALLAGAAAGAAALAADRLARPLAARAADGDIVHVGEYHRATSPTEFDNPDNEKNVLEARSGSGVAVYGASNLEIGVYGNSNASAGVFGRSGGAYGVSGLGDVGALGGVFGRGYGAATGVEGGSDSGTGVRGTSGEGWGVAGASDGTEFGASGGVFGMSDRTVGVFGLSAQGIAVEGRSDHDPATGIGVKGYSQHGEGAVGESDQGTAVCARALTTNATALRVEGRVTFQTAGLGALPIGAKSATVNPGVPLSADTKVLVTLMSDPGLRALKYVSVDPATGTFKVHLTGLVALSPIKFAWFVLD